MKRKKDKLEDLLYRHLDSSKGSPQKLSEESRERILTAMALEKESASSPSTDARTVSPPSSSRWHFAIGVAAAVAVVLLLPFVRALLVPDNVYAIVETVDGSLYRVTDGKALLVNVGEKIPAGMPVRTDGGTGAVLKLSDGGRIEMHADSELSLERANDGTRIRLSTGSVNVTPSKQPGGNLYVQNREGTVPVVGTTFAAAQARLEFEVADVHVSPPRPDGRRVGQMDGVTGNFRAPGLDAVVGGRYEIRNATMMDLITTAYKLEPDAVFGGPGWMTSDWDRFDVIAKPPEGKTSSATSSATIKAMLQSLLADRFKLVVRNDTRPLSAWVLSKGAGEPKMKRAGSSDESACRIVDENERVSCRNVTMDAFVAAIRAGMLTTLPVVNATGIEGFWDFDLNYSVTRGYFGVAENNPILGVIDKQLGLKLELNKIPQPVLVVESVDRNPTANAADLERRLPPPGVEFEVASIRPCEFVNPMSTGGETGARFSASGQVTTGCLSLQRHIAMAWDRPGRLEGAPGWLNSRYFNIVAKAPIPVLDGTDQKYRAMLRNLLINRFKLAYHFEERAVDAYELVAEKPKLKKPDPSGRTGCKLNGGAGFVVGIPNTVACQNVTLAQFAEELGNVGDVYTRPAGRRPVLDATGIEGTWDLTLTYWQVPGPRANADGAERTGSPTIFEAFDKQLGLKLKETSRPRPFFVLDHIEENPTEN